MVTTSQGKSHVTGYFCKLNRTLKYTATLSYNLEVCKALVFLRQIRRKILLLVVDTMLSWFKKKNKDQLEIRRESTQSELEENAHGKEVSFIVRSLKNLGDGGNAHHIDCCDFCNALSSSSKILEYKRMISC